MILFLLKASIALAIFFGFYKLALQKESFFAVNRCYLMASLLLVFLLPFVALPKLMDYQGIVDKAIIKTQNDEIKEPMVEQSSNAIVEESIGEIENIHTPLQSQNEPSNDILYWAGLLYLLGMVVLLLNLLTQLLGIFTKIVKSRHRTKDSRFIILNPAGETEPCSFFNYIFIKGNRYTQDTYKQILEHEKIHVKKYHSIDLMLSELAIVILWFNPLVWLFRREVEKNIEYQTDALLLESQVVVAEDYQMNLLNIASHKKLNVLVSNLAAGQAGYNQSLIKKRIVMMNKQKSNRHNYFKYAFVAPLVLGMLLFLNQPFALNAQENSQSELQGEKRGNLDYEKFEHEQSDDFPPLLYAVSQGDYQKVKQLIEEGADVNRIVNGDGTALTIAIKHGHIEIAKLLLEHGAGPEIGTRADGHPLWLAARNGDIELVKLLIEQGADVNQDFPGDGSALIQASRNGDLHMVEALVWLGAKVDMPVSGDGNPLIIAAKGGHLNVVKYLVKKGADVNYEVVGDEVPLINASEQGHLEVVKYLIDKGADVNKVCKEKFNGKVRVRTALKMAKKNGHEEIVEYLKKKGAIE